MRFSAFLIFLPLVLLTSCAIEGVSKETAPTVTQVDRSSYKLATGDRIRLDVYGEPDLLAEETLDVSGTINFPLLGRLPAKGLTLKELEQAVASRLKAGYLVNPSVRASIVLFRPIYIIGQVRRAGSYPFIEGLTVEKAIALAGGMTEIASSSKIFVLRESPVQAQKQQVKLYTPIFPGDTIIVEESLF